MHPTKPPRLAIKSVPTYTKGTKKDKGKPYQMMLMRFVFLYKSICCGYSFELHRQVDAIQMGTHNICLYREVDKMYTGCNLKSKQLLDSALIGVCAVIRLNTVLNFIIDTLEVSGFP